MSNLNKKILLFFMVVAVSFGLVGCTNPDNSVRIRFNAEEFEIRQNETKLLEPTIIKSSQVGDVELVFTSSDESIVKVENGVLVPVAMGEAIVKVAWENRDIIFDKVVVKVIKASLPTPTIAYNTSMLKGATQTVSVNLGSLNLTDATYSFVALNPEVATISEDGVITALAVGNAKFEVVVKDYEEEEKHEISVNVEESDFAIKYNLNGGVNSSENPVGYSALKLPLPLQNATKVGYTFLGWFDNETKVTEIAAGRLGDVELDAKWEAVEYTLSYEGLENTTFEGEYQLPTKYTIESEDLVLGTPSKVGYKFLGWYNGDAKVEKVAKGSTGNLEFEAKWEVVEYSITYDCAGGEFSPSVVSGTSLKEINLGEYSNTGLAANIYLCDKGVIKNNSLRWQYKILLKYDEELKAYEVVATDAAKKGANSLEVEWTHAIASASVNVSTYAEVGQYVVLSTEAKLGDKDFKANVYLKSQFGAPTKYTVEDEVVLVAPEKVGYTFLGWYVGEDKVEKIVKGSTGNKEFTAKWEVVEYTLSYEELENATFEDGYQLPTKYTIESEDLVLGTPSKVGYKFLGWYNGDVKVEKVAKGSTGNLELEAKWETVKYSISYELDGGENAESNPTEYTIESENIVLANPTKDGFKFAGWAEGTGVVQGSTGNKTFTATWTEIPVHTVTWDLNGGTLETGATLVTSYREGTPVALPTLTRYAHEFLGWYEGDVEVAEIKDKSYELVAKWKNVSITTTELSIEYELNGGNWQEGKVPDADHPMAETFGYVPVKDGFEFDGWVSTSDNESNPPKVVLSAKWKAVEGYKINYVLNGGVNASDNKTFFKESTETFDLLAAIKAGYKFLGWFDEDDQEVKQVEQGTKKDLTLTAEWEAIEYTISYVNVEDSAFAEGYQLPTKYTVESGELVLATPARDGYEFLGWFDANDEKVDKVAVEKLEDLTYTAKWQLIQSTSATISYDLDGGSWNYHAQIVNEFIKDFNAFTSKSITEVYYYDRSTGFWNKNFDKWGWVMKVIYETALSQGKFETSAYPTFKETFENAGNGNVSSGYVTQNVPLFFLQIDGATYNSDYKPIEGSTPVASNGLLCDFTSVTFESYKDKLPESLLAEIKAADSYTTGTVVELPTPVKEGYEFTGWTLNGEPFTFTAETSGNLDLVATWKALSAE